MAHRHLNVAIRQLLDGHACGDGQLLERYVARSESAAFEALVRRHGPMVLGVCQRVLRNSHDAEDAFQATFLVLVRKAASVRPREQVGHWLYGVAYRTALKARAASHRRQIIEKEAGTMRCQSAVSPGEREEWRGNPHPGRAPLPP